MRGQRIEGAEPQRGSISRINYASLVIDKDGFNCSYFPNNTQGDQ